MRKYLITFFGTIILILVFVFLVRILNPLDEQAVRDLAVAEGINTAEEMQVVISQLFDQGRGLDYINWRNIFVVVVFCMMIIISTFTFLHMSFQRLFILKFYEEVSVVKAVRRGLTIAVIAVGLLALRVVKVDFYVPIAFVILVLGIEVGISLFEKTQPKIMEEYLDDSDLQSDPIEPLGVRMLTKLRQLLRYVTGSVITAYSGSRIKIKSDAEAEGSVIDKSVVLSTDESEQPDPKLQDDDALAG